MTRRILLVEPSPTQAGVIRTLLADAGFEVDIVETAAAAEDVLAAKQTAAVLANQSLPDISGIQLCRDVKSRHGRLPVILIAESGNAEQLLQGLTAGADDFLIKSSRLNDLPRCVARSLNQPATDRKVVCETVSFDGRDYHLSLTADRWVSLLVGLLGDVTNLTERCRTLTYELSKLPSGSCQSSGSGVNLSDGVVDEPASPAESETSSLPMGTVLLAEDSPTNQILGMTLLEKAGYRVLLATNGQEVLDQIGNDTEQRIDFILMDVEMPEMDGLEATRRIRRNHAERKHHLLILAMTAHSSPDEQQTCLDAGMDACLSKPLSPEELAEVLQRCHSPGSTTVKQVQVSIGTETGHEPTDGKSPESSVDWNAALSAVNGDRDLLQILIHSALEEWPARLADGRLAIATRNIELLHRTAHTLSGLLRTFRPLSPEESALEISERIEAIPDFSDVSTTESLFAELDRRMAPIIRELQAAKNGNSPG